jgi:mannose-6-phosphate isomerase-like protein (cupin superfamily)
MQKNGKVWGDTSCLLANGAVELHHINFKAGYRCSRHMHQTKANFFRVETGKLIIRVWMKDYDLVDETILGPGDFTIVKPGLEHEFEAISDGSAIELYWAELDHGDIVRADHGGPVPPARKGNALP